MESQFTQRSFRSAISGFTLIELLITITLVVILLMAGVPGMRHLIINNQLQAYTSNLLIDLVLARSESSKRGMLVFVCASVDGLTCSGTWDQGYIVLADSNRSGTPNTGDTPLKVVASAASGTTITASYTGTLAYRPSGAITIGTGANFSVCHSGYYRHSVAVTNIGLASATKTSTLCP